MSLHNLGRLSEKTPASSWLWGGGGDTWEAYFHLRSHSITVFVQVGLFVAPIGAFVHLLHGRWIFGYWVCHIWHAVDVLASTASIMNLTAISLDRFVAIRRSMQYSTIVTHKTCLAAILIVWILSALISFPAIAIWHFSLKQAGANSFEKCEFTNNRVYRVTSSLISFYLPLCLMTFAYTSVYLKAQKQLRILASGTILLKTNSNGNSKNENKKKQSKSAVESENNEAVATLRVHRGGGANRFPATNHSMVSTCASSRNGDGKLNDLKKCPKKPKSSHGSQVNLKETSKSSKLGVFLSERKATKTLGIVFGVFILCWLPFFTLNVVQACTNRNFTYEREMFDFFTLLGYANSCLNPLIYAATNMRLRKAFLQVITRKLDYN